MSFLSGLGNLGGIGKLLDPGALVKDVVNGLLPKDMKIVGDAAGAIVDFKCGNFIGAAQLGMEAVKDLPQAAKGLQGGGPSTDAGGQGSAGVVDRNPKLDPPPPPPFASGESKPLDLGRLVAGIKKLTSLLTDLLDKQGAASSTAANRSEGGTKTDANRAANKEPASSRSAAPSSHARSTANDGRAKPETDATARTQRHQRAHRHEDRPVKGGYWFEHTRGKDASVQGHADTRPSGWRGEPRTPAAGAETARSPTPTAPRSRPTTAAPPPASPVASSTPAPAAAAASGSAAPAAAPAKGETITSMDQIKGMSDAAIRDAVINGRISPEVAKDQTAMMVLQQRMQAITEMNNLMTAMLRALHDMQMAVIQNIRI